MPGPGRAFSARAARTGSPDTSLLFGAVCGDPAPVGSGEGAPETRGVEIAAVSRRSGLLPPRVVQNSTVDRLEAKIVDEAKHRCLGVRRIAVDRESNPPPRSRGTPFSRRLLAKMLLNALITGYPICCATHWLSGMPRSIASMWPSRSSGW
jgi:hypothetical protein